MPPLVGRGGGLVCESVSKADLLSDYFDGKQSKESVDSRLTTFETYHLRDLPPLPAGRVRSDVS